jgi:general secretion pathway protein L
MSTLLILLPPRERLASHTADTVASLRLPVELAYAFSADGRTVARSGRSVASALPKAETVLLVLADADVSWQRISVPKAPAARLRAALAGVMEELLLDDDTTTHLALGPDTTPGQTGWVAVMHKPWLAAALGALEAAGVTVQRVLPSSQPLAHADEPARGHFFAVEVETADTASAEVGTPEFASAFGSAFGSDSQPESGPFLALSQWDGVSCLRLSGGLARALLPAADSPVRYSAAPAVAAAAEQWLGSPVAVLTDAERALDIARSRTNLRQFDMTARHRGSLALRDAWRGLLRREWRAVRWGLAALVAVQLIGLNAWAWQQRQAIDAKKIAMNDLLRNTHPGVRSILDAPLQMQRETERLRSAAGRPGDADLEVLLAAAAGAWPEGQGPVQALRFEPGRLILSPTGFSEAVVAQFRARLLSGGFTAELSDGRVVVTRAPSRAAS